MKTKFVPICPEGGPCPYCGGAATFRLLDFDSRTIRVDCSEKCKVFRISKAAFDDAAAANLMRRSAQCAIPALQMLTLDEAVERMAAGIVAMHADELMRVYRAYPTRAGLPRKVLCSMVSHAIGVRINQAILRSRGEGNYPLAIENMPAIRRVERKVFEGILERAR